jgi:tRNA(Glu) U13 pseudouridine synthase TruD
MSGTPHALVAEAQERDAHASSGNKMVSLAAAIIAVLAALGTLFSHHRSITALTAKNEAILTQARASDLFNRYESKRVRYHVYTAFIAADLPPSKEGKATLKDLADKEQASSLATFSEAERLEKASQDYEEHSERILSSYETLEIGTTFCEIAIVLVSISALASTRIFLTVGCGLATVGLAFLVYGFLQAH